MAKTTKTIRLLGEFSDAVMGRMDASDLSLLPSLMEQLAMVLAEAQASGFPVIAIRAGRVLDMVEAGQPANLIPPGAADAVTSTPHRFFDDSASRAALGRAGRRFAEGQHDLNTQTARLAASLAP